MLWLNDESCHDTRVAVTDGTVSCRYFYYKFTSCIVGNDAKDVAKPNLGFTWVWTVVHSRKKITFKSIYNDIACFASYDNG